MANLARNIPLSLDEELLTAVDRLAAALKENRSVIMRKAIREGLPLVESGGGDMVKLDSELSATVDNACKETELSRNKILLEAIRAGLHAFVSRAMSEKLSLAELQDPKQKEELLWSIEQSYKLYDDPAVREHRKLIWERGNATTRLMDILQHVPEAKRRADAAEKLTEIRRKPGGTGGGPAWLSGLSTEEMEWQIAMAEKYGPSIANWPEAEKKAHFDAIEAKKNSSDVINKTASKKK